METLAVNDRRHLALPDSCLFAPTELQIGPSLSQNEFSRLGTALASVDQASDLWACDYALAGQNRWGDEGLQLAATATRLSVGYLKVSARIAERFNPSRRFANMTREHYRGLCCFPVEWTDEWLPTVAEKGFGAKTLRALAVEAYGSDPKAGYSKGKKKRSVSLPETLYARLKEGSPVRKTAVFIEEILTDFVNKSTPEQQARIAAALSTRDADKVRTRRRKAKKPKVEKPAKIKEPADVKFQLEKFEQAARLTYAERREQQLADGAPAIPVKERGKSKVSIVFTACPGNSYVEDNEGHVRPFRKSSATRFYSLETASAGAREYGEDRGYECEAFLCDKCSSDRVYGPPKSIWHVRAKNFGGHVPLPQSTSGSELPVTRP
jgi:hypothetical protein